MVLLALCPILMNTIGCADRREARMEPIRPPALRPGDRIALIIPSSPIDGLRVERARDHFESLGYKVAMPHKLDRSRGYLAGDDEARAAELMAAFTDPSIRAVFAARGGYGMTRILNLLDYDVIRANPKIVAGYSDITALHLALAAKANLVTFHSPVGVDWGGDEPIDAVSDGFFWRALTGGDESTFMSSERYEISADTGVPLQSLYLGVGRGRLTGGNLTLINTLMGTPYEMDTREAVLFIEDIGERPYRIDRYLSQLRLAGKLDGLAAVIIGHFNDCDPKPGESSLTLDEIFDDYFKPLGIPVVAGFPAGHNTPNITLPMGAQVEVDADQCRVTILENPVTTQ